VIKTFRSILVIGILSTAFQAFALGGKGFSFIDIRKAANMGFADKKAGDKTGGWFDQGPNNDLNSLPLGVRKFGTVPFNIIKPTSNSGKSCIILRGNNLKFLPLDSGAIKIKGKAKLIYFLTACGWNTSINNKVAFITVRYRQGGLYLDIPIRFKKETAGWWHPEHIPNGDIAWKGQSSSADVGIYSFGWINPYPEQEIDSITFVSTNSGAVPAIIAATMVTDAAIASKLKIDLQKKITATTTKQVNSKNATLKVDFNIKGIPVSDDAASLSVGFGMSADYLTAARGLVRAGRGKPFFRLQIGLANPSPAEGVMDFKKLDKYLDYIDAAGGKTMLCFGPTGPIWMATPMNGISMRRNWRPRKMKEYISYCETVLRHCTTDRKIPVKWWQIGNETELKGWSYKYYVQVYKLIAPHLKKIAPSIQIGGPVNCSPNIGWASELLREAGPLVNFLSYHQYGYSEPFDSPSNYVMGKTSRYRNAVSSYRKQTFTLAENRNLPVIVTEANTNPRYQRPLGTDPRIRTMFNAAWYMSALNQFVTGGGRSMCYFTLDGGFGACHYKRGKFTLHPVYHAIWLFRRMGHGQVIPVKSSLPLVEAYAFRDGKVKRLIVINKMATPVKVELNFTNSLGEGQIFVLNSTNAKACANLDNKKQIRFLTPQKANWNNKKITLKMGAYEVIGWESKQ
jgi:Glycosyl hydrolases family 39